MQEGRDREAARMNQVVSDMKNQMQTQLKNQQENERKTREHYDKLIKEISNRPPVVVQSEGYELKCFTMVFTLHANLFQEVVVAYLDLAASKWQMDQKNQLKPFKRTI